MERDMVNGQFDGCRKSQQFVQSAGMYCKIKTEESSLFYIWRVQMQKPLNAIWNFLL